MRAATIIPSTEIKSSQGSLAFVFQGKFLLCLTVCFSTLSFAATDNHLDAVCFVGDTTEPILSLQGDLIQTIELNSAYKELGATARDDVDGDLTSSIVVDFSNVITSQLGSYRVTYVVTDLSENSAAITREVVVVDSPPTITLNGDSVVEIYQNQPYNELGAQANDAVDGDISNEIVINSTSINTAQIGQYEVTYTVVDSNSSPMHLIRKIIVLPTTAEPPEKSGGSIDLFILLLAYLGGPIRKKY